MLACFECRNLVEFVQVSERGDTRLVTVTIRGFRKQPWSGDDGRPAGIYCVNCGESVTEDLESLQLTDDRLASVAPQDFDAEAVAVELQSLRTDAEWIRLEMPGEEAHFDEIPEGLHAALLESLARNGLERLYTHQAAAIRSALNGQNVVQATHAGSGKSLGFVVPVLDILLR